MPSHLNHLLLISITLLHITYASSPPTWTFTAYPLPSCASEPTISLNGTGEVECTETAQQMRSYRFSATTETATNWSYSVRLYDQKECLYLSMIHDERDGECQGVGFWSWNVFGFER
ncbi:hypothetical protein QBC34DRAFT_383560 [Podospora aff. communis PSN243]|uniref:AA1-like domain-containing protein n=1 Tax=Podospora aff. communis PSN243 TaxID=3040156 RepID=A0AAV9GCG6_9PEZI|nr:hypothetical protein QBC34DRAFT_383560 [Podospora aff. communis PSN243]